SKKLIPLVAAALLLVGAGIRWIVYEGNSKTELDRATSASREQANKFAFAEARRGIDAFVAKCMSPKQNERANAFLLELESDQQNWEKKKKEQEDSARQQALEKMKALLAAIEDERENRPTTALQKARELREFAEKCKDQEYIQKAEELAKVLETYLAGAVTLKQNADKLEKDGKLRDAALLIDRLLSEFPNTDSARYALYPIEIVTRPTGVRVTSVRSGIVVGETGDSPLRYRMKPTESVKLLFEKAGYVSVDKDVKDKSIGRIQVDLTDKRELWILPLGVSPSTAPVMLGDHILVTGGSRLFSLKSTKGVNW